MKNSSAKLFPPKTVLVAMYGATIGACSILNIEATTNQACAALLPSEKVDPEFLYYYIKSIKRNLVYKSIGGGQPNISGKILKNTKILLPSVEDQKYIVSILSKAESLIDDREDSIIQIDKFLKIKFWELFGDPTNNQKGFELGVIGDLVSEVKYGTSKKADNEGEYPYLRMNNITYEGYWDFSSLKYIDLQESDLEKYSIRKGDVVFNRTNSKELVGKTAVYQEEKIMVIAGYLIRLRVNERANPWFIWGYLNSYHGKTTLLGLCRNIVGMANINAKELQEIKILIPPIELQNKYSKIIEQVQEVKLHYYKSLKELERLFASLVQKLLRDNLEASTPESVELESTKNEVQELDNKKTEVRLPQAWINQPFGNVPDDIIEDLRLLEEAYIKNHEIPFSPDYLKYRLVRVWFKEPFTFEDLWKKIIEFSFKNPPDYDAVKTSVFQWLREDDFFSQCYNENNQKLEFIINETA